MAVSMKRVMSIGVVTYREHQSSESVMFSSGQGITQVFAGDSNPEEILGRDLGIANEGEGRENLTDRANTMGRLRQLGKPISTAISFLRDANEHLWKQRRGASVYWRTNVHQEDGGSSPCNEYPKSTSILCMLCATIIQFHCFVLRAVLFNAVRGQDVHPSSATPTSIFFGRRNFLISYGVGAALLLLVFVAWVVCSCRKNRKSYKGEFNDAASSGSVYSDHLNNERTSLLPTTDADLEPSDIDIDVIVHEIKHSAVTKTRTIHFADGRTMEVYGDLALRRPSEAPKHPAQMERGEHSALHASDDHRRDGTANDEHPYDEQHGKILSDPGVAQKKGTKRKFSRLVSISPKSGIEKLRRMSRAVSKNIAETTEMAVNNLNANMP
ncbi:hypothetical protein CAPTEDRAFT_213411 [Capitella teleta]|uniref:Uncharacterized protein n=1 Tax=Capitella teleta TaxID=283909 RepID=R7UNI9_CAPTE|nr:hypothetical protein CAPTEDRAFT_213411 [Capitella teleta]|eukprot:ELU08074.1 hypothetical protein CAPTEDRAFT_213411 [Capitella teleta]